MKKNQDEEINKEIVKSVISRGIPVEKFFELGGEIIKLDTSPNSTHVNVFEMAGIDPKTVSYTHLKWIDCQSAVNRCSDIYEPDDPGIHQTDQEGF